jgi:8-oxo-dGTP diphosphatase
LTIHATLCFILENGKVLLLRKSEGLFGQGKWNAPGGKMRLGESAIECAVREVFEETGLTAKNLEPTGTVHFYKHSQRESPDWTVHVFVSRMFAGTLVPGREGVPRWFEISALPFAEMWEDDKFWSHLALGGLKFEGWFYYSGDFESLEDHKIEMRQGNPLALATDQGV